MTDPEASASTSLNTASAQLACWAMAGVFSELAYVRLCTTMASGIAYYGNLLLLVGIVGLAAGMFLPSLARFAAGIPWLMLPPLMLGGWLAERNLLQTNSGEFLWLEAANLYPKPVDFDLQLALLLLCIALLPSLVLLGAGEGRAFLRHREGVRPYLVAAAGGVGGGALFLITNRLVPSPLGLTVVWSLLVGGVVAWGARSWVARVVLMAGLLGVVSEGAATSADHLWSPYQRIDEVVLQDRGEIHVLSNGMFIMNISAIEYDAVRPEHRYPWMRLFEPLVNTKTRGLVLGSGGGTNDVREMLHRGAASVTAVEIDPTFIALGRKWDPERSYDDPRVRVVNDDARHFVGVEPGEYDVIYMPFLDSQTNASNQARFRLDSFLYTVDGLQQVYNRLAEDGTLVINFTTGTPWLFKRLFDSLTAAAEGATVTAWRPGDRAQILYMASRKPHRGWSPEAFGYTDVTAAVQGAEPVGVASDDWPFFYTERREVPHEHVRLLITVLLLMMVTLLIARRSLVDPTQTPLVATPTRALNLYAWASGAGFFFIELRTIGALAPVLGSTYESQALVVMAVLTSSVAGAALAASRPPLPAALAWGALFLSLGLAASASALFHPFHGWMPSSSLMVIAMLTPTFVAGYLYVLYLRGHSERTVLGMQRANLFGGAVGGLAEAVVVVTGFSASILVAVAVYALALVAALWISAATAARR